MRNLENLKSFIAIYESNSITKAARQLNVSPASISKRLSKLESELDVQLIERSTHSLCPTSMGRVFYQKIKTIMRDLEDCESWIQSVNKEAAGAVRISLPEMLVTQRTFAFLQCFAESYENIMLEFDVSNDVKDLIAANVDFSFRTGKLDDSRLVAIPFTSTEHVFCASQSYIDNHKLPESHEHLLEVSKLITPSFINISQTARILLPEPEVKSTKHSQGLFAGHKANSLAAIKAMTLSGIGIALLPEVFVKDEIESGQLKKLYPDYRSPPMPVSLVYQKKLCMTKPLELFKEYVKSRAII